MLILQILHYMISNKLDRLRSYRWNDNSQYTNAIINEYSNNLIEISGRVNIGFMETSNSTKEIILPFRISTWSCCLLANIIWINSHHSVSTSVETLVYEDKLLFYSEDINIYPKGIGAHFYFLLRAYKLN